MKTPFFHSEMNSTHDSKCLDPEFLPSVLEHFHKMGEHSEGN